MGTDQQGDQPEEGGVAIETETVKTWEQTGEKMSCFDDEGYRLSMAFGVY